MAEVPLMLIDGNPRPHRHRLYIDESGDHAITRLDSPAHRYLAILGVWFRLDPEYREFADSLEALKSEVFGKRPGRTVILHRIDIVHRRGPFGILARPEKRAAFDAGLLNLIRASEFTVVCVTIDKLEHRQGYAASFHPYHCCLEEMLNRYTSWLGEHDAVGDVMAESRGRTEDEPLKSAYQQIHGTGRLLYDRPRNRRVLTSNDLKVKPKSANEAGLQLADLLAHPVKQFMLRQRKLIPDESGQFVDRLIDGLHDKLHHDDRTGRIDNYGLIWLPK